MHLNSGCKSGVITVFFGGMAMARIFNLFILLITISVLFGCSSGGGMDVTSPEEPMANGAAADSHQLWGMWQLTADPVAGTLDAVQVRMADMHLNAMRFLEPPPYVYLTVESLQFNGNIIEVKRRIGPAPSIAAA